MEGQTPDQAAKQAPKRWPTDQGNNEGTLGKETKHTSDKPVLAPITDHAIIVADKHVIKLDLTKTRRMVSSKGRNTRIRLLRPAAQHGPFSGGSNAHQDAHGVDQERSDRV